MSRVQKIAWAFVISTSAALVVSVVTVAIVVQYGRVKNGERP